MTAQGLLPVVMAIVGANTLTTIIGVIVYAIMVVARYALLLERSFSLISEFPNRVMKWMGSGTS